VSCELKLVDSKKMQDKCGMTSDKRSNYIICTNLFGTALKEYENYYYIKPVINTQTSNSRDIILSPKNGKNETNLPWKTLAKVLIQAHFKPIFSMADK